MLSDRVKKNDNRHRALFQAHFMNVYSESSMFSINGSYMNCLMDIVKQPKSAQKCILTFNDQVAAASQ